MIHFLLCIVGTVDNKNILVDKTSIPVLLYVDGTFKNLLNYPENCVEWLNFLNAKQSDSPIYPIYVLFANRKLAEMIHELEFLFKEFEKIGEGTSGDKFKISEAKINYGEPSFSSIKKLKMILTLLSNYTNWNFCPDKWTTSNFKIYNFTKKIEETLNNKKFGRIIGDNPISLAITATKRIEYTLPIPDDL